ncbi:MAG: alpha/beta fold hydrolase [Actinomycetota bacterium]|nr:alpha/beta fold hydrolase [Actinomycetota bacterium]
MRRLLLVLCLLLLAALPAAADAKVRKGPGGTAFYTPPSPLPSTESGALIWARRLTGTAALKGGASNRLLLYVSTAETGPTAVSGTLSVPKGRPPKRGWPVISWAHGTTGIADQCAPSRDSASNPAHDLIDYAYPLLRRWLKAGYAVVRTDYVGLGTPGDHPYLEGRSEAYAVLDAVAAARKLDKRLSNRVVLAGHSQGGQAVLWAASRAPSYRADLRIRGTVALAPVSHLAEQTRLLTNLKEPSALSGLVAMILRGIDITRPNLGVSAGLSDRAAPFYPQTLTECLPALSSPGSLGGIPPAEVIRAGADTSVVTSALERLVDPEDLTIRTPVRIQQGTEDTTVFKAFTDPLVADYRKRGNPVTYQAYAGVDHGGAVTSPRSARDATRYIRRRLR